MEKGNLVGNDTFSTDPNLVDWDGPDDTANPRNWPKILKMANVMLVSLSMLYCKFCDHNVLSGSQTYAERVRLPGRDSDNNHHRLTWLCDGSIICATPI